MSHSVSGLVDRQDVPAPSPAHRLALQPARGQLGATCSPESAGGWGDGAYQQACSKLQRRTGCAA